MANTRLAVILAAGAGTRLRAVTEKPKCLLELGGRTLLDYQLEALQANGISDVLVVTGYGAEHIEHRYAGRVRTLHDPNYAAYNNIHSLWTARQEVAGRDFLCLHSDVLFHPAILRPCLHTQADITFVVDPALVEETMKARVVGDSVVEIGKEIPLDQQSGTFLGIARFRPTASRLLGEALGGLLRDPKRHQDYFTACLPSLRARGLTSTYTVTGALPWIEIDFDYELAKAECEVLPHIAASSRMRDG